MKPKDELKLEAIAQATYQCVQSRGLSALTLADIARSAGVATSTLYVYYPSRQVLLDALYERAKTVTFTRLIEGAESQLSTKARIRTIWLNMLENRLKNQAELTFLEQYASSGSMSQANRALSERFVSVFQSILEAGQKEEILKAVPQPFLMSFLVGSVQESAKLIGLQTVPDDAATRNTAFQLCWDAIKA
jgi:AcrR family transcriptional regulator